MPRKLPESKNKKIPEKSRKTIRGFESRFPFRNISPERTKLINQHMKRMRNEIDSAKKFPIEQVKKYLNLTLLQRGIDFFASRKTTEIGKAVQSLKTINFFFNEFANSSGNPEKRTRVKIQIRGFMKPSDFLWAGYSEKQISGIFSEREIQEDKVFS